MSRIYNIIPGCQVDDSAVMERIFALLAHVKFDTWIEVNERIYSMDFFRQRDEFYVMYLDPRGVIKKLYRTCGEDIVGFMKEYIDWERGDGVDIVICTDDICNAVVCNHDGQIFVLECGRDTEGIIE